MNFCAHAGRLRADLAALPRSTRALGLVGALCGLALTATAPFVGHGPDVPAVAAALPVPQELPQASPDARCVYIGSYHVGYSWSDRLEAALAARLEDGCELHMVHLDTKRDKTPESIERHVAAALELIERVDPDIVIATDDNAVRYAVVPHLLGGPTPVVFAAVNWTVREYGLPAPGVTGMVEIAPLRALLGEAKRMVPAARRAVYIGANTATETKNYERYVTAARSVQVAIDAVLVDTMEAWEQAFESAQEADFLLIGSSAGIRSWDDERAADFAREHGLRTSYTVHDWMMPVTMMGFTKIPEEQGEWAADSALEILSGVAPEAIPYVTNRAFDLWINESLIETARVVLSDRIRLGARRTEAPR